MTERIALFDFDGTLTRGDSLIPFLRAVRGDLRLALDLLAVSPRLAAYAAGLMKNHVAKEALLRRTLAGMPIDALKEAGEAFARDTIPSLLRADTLARLRAHLDNGDVCILVSASLDVYLEPWAKTAGFRHVIASRLDLDPDGRITGRLAGGNCHGEEKVERIKKLFGEKPAAPMIAYGDSKGDFKMFEFAGEAYLVRKSITPFTCRP